MTTADSILAERSRRPAPAIAQSSARPRRRWLSGFVALWIFSGGFVLIEPSPYELAFLLLLPVALFSGFSLHRAALPPLLLLIGFIPFGLIGAFQAKNSELSANLLFVAVTAFLWLTTVFVANYVADAPHRHMRLIMKAYMAAAVVVSIIGTLAYLGLLPGADIFLLYGRAKATFQDPNVFGPFLILPAMFALQKVLLARPRRALIASAIYILLFIGVFVSFSRAAWGHLAVSSLLVYGLVFVLEARAKDKVRMIVLAMVGVIGLTAILGALLSIDSVRSLFNERFALEQNYDSGSTGRFGRQAYAVGLAITHPFGIAPKEFRKLRITEEPHDTYISVILNYGWLGGMAFITMLLSTLWRGVSLLPRASPNRFLLIPLLSVFFPLLVEAAIIDTDHWRHLYLVAGLIWGVTAGYQTRSPAQRLREGALV